MENDSLLFGADIPEPENEEFPVFEQEFCALTGIRLDLYKEKQMKRRINTLIARKGFSDYASYLARLKSDPAELAFFTEYITINVTEFFRTPEQWKHFEEEALKDLLSRAEGPLKIWSCACSSGEEPYSLAISILRKDASADFRILATDIDTAVLKAAEEGCYSIKSTETIPAEDLSRFFIPDRGVMRAAAQLKSHVEFKHFDLLKEDYPQDCDLIVCRNVLIYFTEEAKNTIYGKITQSLKPGGYLFTGNTEQIIYYKQYGLKKIAGYLYQKG